jgi:hypothetical protein
MIDKGNRGLFISALICWVLSVWALFTQGDKSTIGAFFGGASAAFLATGFGNWVWKRYG